ncbi:MAG: hypothetical protein R2748_02890 [Bryobacterales bacterium]
MTLETRSLLPLLLVALAATLPGQRVEQLRDPVTGAKITRFVSKQHETHHYYFISPWSPDESKIAFFRFNADVDKLTATGRYPGALWVMDADGSNERKLVDNLQGHYHVGVNQVWGPKGEYIYFWTRVALLPPWCACLRRAARSRRSTRRFPVRG